MFAAGISPSCIKLIRNSILLGIGICAAIFASATLYFSGCTPQQVFSAFIQWVFMPYVIHFIQWPIWPPLKGFIAGELLSLPLMVLVYVDYPISVILIVITSAFLGTYVSIIIKKFADLLY